MAELLEINRDVSIPLDEIVLQASRSSGPGGQHANKTESRIEASFDVAASAALDDAHKARSRRAAVRSCGRSRRTPAARRATARSRWSGSRSA